MFDDKVANGVRLLNSDVTNWRSEINKHTFDIKSAKNCILGQLFGSFSQGLIDLEISNDTAVECGFDLFDLGRHRLKDSYDALQEAWLAVL